MKIKSLSYLCLLETCIVSGKYKENRSLDITICQRIEYAYRYIQTFKLRNTFMGQTYRTNVRIIFYHWPLFIKTWRWHIVIFSRAAWCLLPTKQNVKTKFQLPSISIKEILPYNVRHDKLVCSAKLTIFANIAF